MSASNRANVAALIFAMGFPSLVTWVYFQLLADAPAKLQQAAYGGGKLLQFAFPVFWVVCWQRRSIWEFSKSTKPPRLPASRSIGFGAVFGLLVVAGMIAIYAFWLPAETVAALRPQVIAKLQAFKIDNGAKYAAFGLFYAIVHSFLEEYYFRWFVFGQLRSFVRWGPAAVISGLAFMSHHVIVLALYFHGLSLETVLLSACIAVGGTVWAWQYERSRSLSGPWISHLLVDAGIFGVGYQIARQAFP